jgi:hypothetical protein
MRRWIMVQPTAADTGDDLHLAQLACARLVGLVQGAVSIGLPALVTGRPEPETFLQDQFRVIQAFALVLHTVCWPAGNTQAIQRLREKSGKLLSALDDFQGRLLAAFDASGFIRANLQAARMSAAALFDSITEYAKLVRLDGDSILKAKGAVLEVFEGMETFDSSRVPGFAGA